MKQYLDALNHVMENGKIHENRTGVDTKRVFAHTMRFDLTEGFPAVTTKKLAWRAVVGELLWFLEGSTDERRLAEITFEKDRHDLKDKKTIWTANADNQGRNLGYMNNDHYKFLGPVYGKQWRSFDDAGTDQIETIIDQLKYNPESRRIILSAWNPNQIDEMALPPCHVLSHFLVDDGKLTTIMYQRSCDMFLGVPFNIASYALLTHILSQICNLEPAEFIWIGGDVHIYTNHVDAVVEQVSRQPRPLPTLQMPQFTSLDEVLETKPSQYILSDYDPMESIVAEMVV